MISYFVLSIITSQVQEKAVENKDKNQWFLSFWSIFEYFLIYIYHHFYSI